MALQDDVLFRRRSSQVRACVVVLGVLAAPAVSGQLVISEFRLRGPNGANDEFIEIANNSGSDHTVAGGGTGYAVAASNGVARCVIPNGTVIPSNGHYLCANSVGYSLGSYPAGNGTTATGDATYTTDIPDNAGIAIFNTSVAANFTLGSRFDAAGSTSEANTLYKEGTGYPILNPLSIDYAFTRDRCGKVGSISTFGLCPSGGALVDTNNNLANFVFVDTFGASLGAGQRLGAPGPENLSSPVSSAGATLPVSRIDACVGTQRPPNMVRDLAADPPNHSTFGTLDFRRTITNNTGANVTRLRFRFVDLTAFLAPVGIADLRPRTSTAQVVTVDRPPCGTGTSNVTVEGTTLEQPPSQPNGGGFNSTFSVDTVTFPNPLVNGASIDVRFLLGVQQRGRFKLGLIVEALPGGGAYVQIQGCTDGCPKADFDGNGSSDILFRSVPSPTINKAWLMNGVTRLAEVTIAPNAADGNWQIRGADDFESHLSPGTGPDFRTDLVFWNQATGNVEFWLMNGATRTGSAVPLGGAPVLPINWDLAATGDFNQDGRPDIVWRNVTSQKIVIWTMSGTARVGSIIPSPDQAVDANWAIVGAADYTNDGNTDFLWYNATSGKIVTWYMNASVVRTAGQFTTPDAAGDNNWKVVASSDFSGASVPATPPIGSPDVLWRNQTSGNQVVWHLNFNSVRTHGEFTSPAANTNPLDWVIVGPR